jgi:uncharacterized membrane protein
MNRGLDHEASIRIAKLIRNLALDLFNKHDKHYLSIRLTEMLQEVFAEVGKVMEYVDKDIDQLDKIAEERAWSEPIVKLLDEVYRNIEENPSLAYDEALKVLNTAPKLIAKMEAAIPGVSTVQRYKDSIAMLLMHCAIVYGNRTKEWKKCKMLLDEALNKYAVSPDVISKIQTNLEMAENNFKYQTGKNNDKYTSNQTSKHIVNKTIKLIVGLILCLPIACLVGVIAIQENLEKRRNNYSSNQIFKRFINRFIQFIVAMIACLAMVAIVVLIMGSIRGVFEK